MSLVELAARLNAAAEAGAWVTIRYALGSGASTRRIMPIAATGMVLRARDVEANRLRVFLLPHVELIGTPAPPEKPAAAPPPRDAAPPSEQERLASLVETLQRFGWHVKPSSEGLSVHKLGADGTPRSAAVASIRRNAGTAVTSGLVRRPWTVVAPGLARAQSFASLEPAIALFLRQAAEHAPAVRRRPPIT